MIGLSAAVETALNKGLGTAALIAAGCTILFSAASAIAAVRFRRFRQAEDERSGTEPPDFPSVTILKPIKGLDYQLYENLASFARQRYPSFQLILAAQNPDDPALEIAEAVRRDFPRTDIEIVVSKNGIGHNPKVNNLSNAAPYIKHALLMISDSDINVPPDFLARVVRPLADPDVGMVTCFYRSRVGRGLGGIFEALAVNAQFLPQTLLAGFLLRMSFAMGAVMLVRKSLFDDIGGFGALSEHLADDFILGRRVLGQKKRIAFSSTVVDSVPSVVSIREHLLHMSRWARTIRVCQPGGYAGLIILQGLPLLTLHISLFGLTPVMTAMWLATAACRMASVAWIHGVCLDTPVSWSQISWIPAADFAHFFTWTAGFRSQTVLWRGESFDTTVGGRLVPKRRKAVATVVAG